MFNMIAMISLAASLFVGATAAQAASTVTDYTCTLRVFDASNDVVIEQVFQAADAAGTHGGETTSFVSKDGQTKVAVAVDGKWMLLNWSKNDKTIANAVFVIASPSQEPRVAILYNPENAEEQASMDCQPNLQL